MVWIIVGVIVFILIAISVGSEDSKSNKQEDSSSKHSTASVPSTKSTQVSRTTGANTSTSTDKPASTDSDELDLNWKEATIAAFRGTGKILAYTLDATNKGLESLNEELDEFNKKLELENQHREQQRNIEKQQFQSEHIMEFNELLGQIKQKYGSSGDEIVLILQEFYQKFPQRALESAKDMLNR